jgi:hypothetical protein
MYGNRPVTPGRALAVAGFLLAAVIARAADTPQFQPVQARTEVQAPNYSPTPEDYKRLQSVAPEVVTMRVTSVSTQAAVTENNTPGALLVTAQAAVTGVVRSATNLTVGSTIYLVYGYVPSAPGAPAPPPTPVLIKNKDYRAYLTGGPGKTPYSPAAGAQSYVDPSTPLDPADGPAATTPKSAGPIADPALLPTPENPNPAGSVRLRGVQLDQLVKLVQHDKQWAVSIAESDPVPLQMLGPAKPVLVVFYSVPLRAPVTQPAVLVYQAGTLPAPAPAKGTITIQRALVLDSDHRALGDALWAQRVEDNMRPIPLPLWHWAEYKVDVEDPATHQTQTILFTPAAPASAKTTAP